LFPKTGGLQEFSAEVTVPGSDLQYYKLDYSHRRYFPVVGEFVFSANGLVGYGDSYGGTSRLPLFENFFAGGPKSIRGFKAFTLGPRDSSGDPIGGNLVTTANLELLFPPPFIDDPTSVRLAAFLDLGNAFDTDGDNWDASEIRYSTGIGASWLSPLGALTLSYAVPLNDKETDETEEFQFSFGTTF
jgi:outer membrane protein insertion porin family